MDLTFMIYMVITFKDYDNVVCVAYQLFQYICYIWLTLLISPPGDNSSQIDRFKIFCLNPRPLAVRIFKDIYKNKAARLYTHSNSGENV